MSMHERASEASTWIASSDVRRLSHTTTEPYICPRCSEASKKIDHLRLRIENEASLQFKIHRIAKLGELSEIVFNLDCSSCNTLLAMAEQYDFRSPCTWCSQSKCYDLFAVPSLLALNDIALEKDGRDRMSVPREHKDTLWLQVTRAWSTSYGQDERYHEELHQIGKGHGCLAELPARHSESAIHRVRRVESSKADFAAIRQWIKWCEENHTHGCTPPEALRVPNLKLIHCQSRRVVPAKQEDRYSALSYVWGVANSEGTTHKSSEALSDRLPLTIEDAMKVTLELGLEYIWIDRYCIPQNAVEDKHIQIRNMHWIYHGAQVTMIAAAGKDPEYGLPGVSQRPRRSQLELVFGSSLLLHTGGSLSRNVNGCVWAGRAWTMQEALLSNRRLVFTDEQVYFECNRMDCCETIEKSLRNLFSRDDREPINRKGHFPSHGIPKQPKFIWNQINEYLQRRLSYDDDALNGLLGILEAMQSNFRGFQHVCGLPLIIMDHHSTLAEAICGSICWKPAWKMSRRENLPSWSWCGWKGRLDCSECGPGLSRRIIPGSADVWLELDDGSLVHDLEDLRHLPTFGRWAPQMTRFIHVQVETVLGVINPDGWVAPEGRHTWGFTLIPVDDWQPTRPGPGFDYWEMETAFPECELSRQLDAGLTWQGLVFQFEEGRSQLEIIIVRRKKEWVERTGTLYATVTTGENISSFIKTYCKRTTVRLG